jgi:hypothetical protein
MMKKIFMIGIGGSLSKVNIEIHDLQFVVAECIEDTYESLKKDWYGESLHLDEYKMLLGADGFSIELKDYPQEIEEKIFFVNMGGYQHDVFGELHESGLIVAKDEKEAKDKGHKVLLKQAESRHIDNIYELCDLLKYWDENPLYLHISYDGKAYDLKPDWNGYRKLS